MKKSTAYTTYAEIVERKNIHIKEFSPSLLQEYIDKDYEVRSFYLKGAIYSMAILSQANSNTAIDFRKYDVVRPNRYVPYKLPDVLEKKMKTIMDLLKLVCGSFDIVKSTGGSYYFLEINPYGEFELLSRSCNYNLEYKYAKAVYEEYIK